MDVFEVLVGMFDSQRQVMMQDAQAEVERAPGSLGHRGRGLQARDPFAVLHGE